ncbi:hypothetical protein [Chelativorans sp.]|uniref:hypothetical protein n=1 Tax=Chelativorans sp. TaxID=2203393 RepID=UPI002810BFBA|nr:hypothetical protein [Chelativorans sp.]
MDEFQATPSNELSELRARSAQVFGDLLLAEAVRQLAELGGEEALDHLRLRVGALIEESHDHERHDDRAGRLALEELERAIQLAQRGSSQLRGWTEDAPPSIEEQKMQSGGG